MRYGLATEDDSITLYVANIEVTVSGTAITLTPIDSCAIAIDDFMYMKTLLSFIQRGANRNFHITALDAFVSETLQ